MQMDSHKQVQQTRLSHASWTGLFNKRWQMEQVSLLVTGDGENLGCGSSEGIEMESMELMNPMTSLEDSPHGLPLFLVDFLFFPPPLASLLKCWQTFIY